MISMEEIVLTALQGGPMTTMQIICALNEHGKFLSGRILRRPLLAMVADGRMREAKISRGKKGRLTASVWYLPDHTIGQVEACSKTADKSCGAAFRHANELHYRAGSAARSKRAPSIP